MSRAILLAVLLGGAPGPWACSSTPRCRDAVITPRGWVQPFMALEDAWNREDYVYRPCREGCQDEAWLSALEESGGRHHCLCSRRCDCWSGHTRIQLP